MRKKILYIGESNPSSTSFHRASALTRLGHTVYVKNPKDACKNQLDNYLLNKIHYHTGYRYIQNWIKNWIATILLEIETVDLIWVNCGAMIGVKSIQLLKQKGCPVILYNNDDPTGGRDGRRFDTLLKSIPYYDLCVVMRNDNMQEYKLLGADNVMRVFMSYDEIQHKPNDTSNVPLKFRSEVAFIGTWMPKENRDKFLMALISAGIPISIWGNSWQKSPYYSKLKPFIKGGSIYGRDYVSAIQGAKICIGLLSKGNRDLHTTRSLEIPYIGSILCAEKTTEHTQMYLDGEEAIFWSNADECAKKCKELLNNLIKLEKIRKAGALRVRLNKVGNEDVCAQILDRISS